MAGRMQGFQKHILAVPGGLLPGLWRLRVVAGTEVLGLGSGSVDSEGISDLMIKCIHSPTSYHMTMDY